MILKIIIYLFFILYPGPDVFGAPEALKWNEKKSTHFIIYYKKAPLDFVQSLEEMAEYYYEDITRNLGFTRYKGWSYDNRAKIYIYDDDKDYVESAKQARWSHGVADSKDKEIRTFPAAHGFFDSTLPHELGHIIFREFVGFKAEIPLWFEEGVAMYQEKAKRWGVHEIVLKAVEDGKFIPLKDLTHLQLYSNSDPELVSLFYAESASIVNYIINELGQFRFVNLCREFQKGTRRFEENFKKVYVQFKSLDDLNKAWVNYLKK